MSRNLINEQEVALLLNDVLEKYGYDFTDYAPASINRRVNHLYQLDRFVSFAEFRYRIISDPAYAHRFVEEITVNVTEMFRDPSFYQALRMEVLPVLATYPFIRVWHAGCSTGEEVYSFAILLKEAKLLHKAIIYATDLNTSVLEKGRRGMFRLSQMQQYSRNYMEAGGTEDFSSYYTANYEYAKFREELGEKIIFSPHNLVTDSSFNEFQLIICRNVLIYFNKELQDRVLTLFSDSLEQLGYLALGSKETLNFTKVARKFKQLEGREKIWRKIQL
ncbi:MCP methyltransferase, CheR-type [Chitinophaga terrae (ex Kim and Jung 2007)]|uniref:MCP methyltransferase, CheR-type n=1 Tax=Chitinophaga terrae (ex Kim and Jung 2007) TaxID=408074 RepID=A0A1H3Y8L8_9BACT|nr:protein-glutamate O-methyltransferase CheR [Chitinophaga terrae (ex Kim and Jung 2007)]GEP90879.1 chemotaxis protein CheR [Chitinophaga terrae (ex Kim and Jung 2007)]SEA07933.1 MCP methyltransferase, CheR-type [Chitinophaga terrae (ex Kim and Jung 2007)]